jgi:hypothetical protein
VSDGERAEWIRGGLVTWPAGGARPIYFSPFRDSLVTREAYAAERRTADDVPPGYFRAAAGNLVREDDPLAAAFRELIDRIGEICRVFAPVLAVRRERVSAMHGGYRQRQIARRRRRR